MTLYKTKIHFSQIEKVEVDKFNDKSVWLNNRREGRFTDYAHYYETFEQAKSYLIQKAHGRVIDAENRTKTAIEDLEKVMELAECK